MSLVEPISTFKLFLSPYTSGNKEVAWPLNVEKLGDSPFLFVK